MSLFEIATKNKYRYPFKGIISTEDLWDLRVQDLDQIYKELNRELKKCGEDSLLKTKSSKETDLANKIEIIKYIVAVKEADRDRVLHAREVAAKKQRILEVMAEKENKALTEMSIDDLQKMLDELD